MGRKPLNGFLSCRAMIRTRAFAFGVLLTCHLCTVGHADEGTDAEMHFERQVRPILATRCVTCHGPGEQMGAVRLDSKDGVMAAQSRNGLLQTLKGLGTAPAACTLEERFHAAFERWAAEGFPWPSQATVTSAQDRATVTSQHWAFQPLRVSGDHGVATADIDSFIESALKKNGLTNSPSAGKATLLRRLSYVLTGLPPQVIFGNDLADLIQGEDGFDDDTWSKLVDRVLASPHYGEHWARHWLDVARYSDTKGYVYGREEKRWPHAWAYRDWVVNALNEDMGYDRFVQLQIAADQMEDRRDSDLAAMGFLTIGRRFLGVKRDIFDDRIDVVTRGILGLTVSCARCHDHKYDPISSKDYYGLYSVFENSVEKLQWLSDDPSHPDKDKFEQKQKELERTLAQVKAAAETQVRERVSEYLAAQLELDKYPAEGFDQIFKSTDIMPAFVHAWRDQLRLAKEQHDPVFLHWHHFPDSDFKSPPPIALDKANPVVASAFKKSPGTFKEVIETYGTVFREIDQKWNQAKAANPELEQLPDAHEEQIRQVLYGVSSPCRVPEGPLTSVEYYFFTDDINKLWGLTNELSRLILNADPPVRSALALNDRSELAEVRVFLRGNSLNLGDLAPRAYLSHFSKDRSGLFSQGSGRLELARAMTDPANPLTARVIINRVWTHVFGNGLVETPSDFGVRADPPSHPELLDELAYRFMEKGWNLKPLLREMLTSRTWRQASEVDPLKPEHRAALQKDPANRLLWKMNSHRLSFEQMVDTMNAVSKDLELSLGGKPVESVQQVEQNRRSLYTLIDRQFVPAENRVFDFASPDLHIPKRTETSVPQQALFFLNHPFILERARKISSAAGGGEAEEQVQWLFNAILQRSATTQEVAESLAFVREIGPIKAPEPCATARDWSYGYGAFDEKTQRVVHFEKLPHFDGEAWQGGPKWPDAKLGWVRLTAEGGHPGNTKSHAAIRRWTAPRDMVIEVKSQLQHDAVPGDGIRGFVVSSLQGNLASAELHKANQDLNLEDLKVKQGETLDFLVDIRNGLNSDQFIWKVEIHPAEGSVDSPMKWLSHKDFILETRPPMNAWEQLAHALLCSNEFQFVD
jgi:hypothetical protein